MNMHPHILLLSLLLTLPLLADNKAQPAIAPVPAPAFMDVVTFEFRADGESKKVVVTSTPALQRIDDPEEHYSVIYNPQTQFYTGLEHGNYTYWEFSWPEVRSAVENSKRYEKHLQDLGNEGVNPDAASPATNAPNPVTSSVGGDSSGYVWHPTIDKKRISDLDCVQWIGETDGGPNIEAWCYAGPLPQVQAAIAVLQAVSEPMALVPVRTMVPDSIFPVYDALLKGGVTPVLITWGDETNKNHFRFVEARNREGQLKLFSVPKLYVKTTLITMDGMIDSQPAPGLRGSATPPRVDHSNPNPTPQMGQ
jgi:hypothetical protein